jgi:hypothetical protein
VTYKKQIYYFPLKREYAFVAVKTNPFVKMTNQEGNAHSVEPLGITITSFTVHGKLIIYTTYTLCVHIRFIKRRIKRLGKEQRKIKGRSWKQNNM